MNRQLLFNFLSLLDQWSCLFSQQRIFSRIKEHATGVLLTLGGPCIARVLASTGKGQVDWSSTYRLFSKSPWEPQGCFDPVIASASAFSTSSGAPITLAGDLTHVKRNGPKVAGSQLLRDPVGSLPYHVNLIRGVSFLHIGLLAYPPDYLVPPINADDRQPSPRCLPVHFSRAPSLKKPSRKASPEQIDQYKKLQKARPVMQHTRQAMIDLRHRFDEQGYADRDLHFVFDGSFCNRTIFEEPIERVRITCRCRKNAAFRFADPDARGPRFYKAGSISAEQIRQDHVNYPWKTGFIRFGGKSIEIRYKSIDMIYWPRAGRRPLRLIVVSENAHRGSGYSSPCFGAGSSYLLTTDTLSDPIKIIQSAFDRWQIEVAHREQKSNLKIGRAHVRHHKSVERHPAFAVAIYSLLHLAALQTYGWERSDDFAELPKWRRKATRPSFQDLLVVIRRQLLESDENGPPGEAQPAKLQQILDSAAA